MQQVLCLLLSHLGSSSYPVFHLAPCFCVVGLIHPSGYKYLIRYMIYKYILTFFGLYFHILHPLDSFSHSLDSFPHFMKQKCHFDEAQFTWVSPLILLLLSYLRDHCLFQDEECVPTCFLLRFIVLALIFKSLIHFELIFASCEVGNQLLSFFINFLVFILYVSVLCLHICMCTI